MSDLLTRTMPVSVRAIDAEKREAEFVASTETPVDMGWGQPEVLRASGAKLERYRANPVVLNSHRRNGIEDIVGQAVDIQQDADARQIVMRVRYDDDEYGERALRKVKSGSLRAVSVGYRPLTHRELEAGEEDGEGDALVRGPATVVTGWELLEVSMVPVPADPNALKRAYAKGGDVAETTKKAPPPKAREDDEKAKDDEDEEQKAADESEEAKAEDMPDDEDECSDEEKALAAAIKARRKHLLTDCCPADLREWAEGPGGPLADYEAWDAPLPVAEFKRAVRAERQKRSHGAVGTPAIDHTTGATSKAPSPAPAAPVTTTTTAATERKALGRSLISILKGA